MGSLVLTGDTSGSVTVTVPAVAGSNTATIGAATGTHYPFTAGTAVASTSGTSIDFTSLPSWIKRITIVMSGVSTNGTAFGRLRLSTGGTFATSGYVTNAANIQGSGNTGVSTSTAGFDFLANLAAYTCSGAVRFTLLSGNTWVCEGLIGSGTSAPTPFITVAGTVTLSGTLDGVRITSTNGTDTFDAGSINILYE